VLSACDSGLSEVRPGDELIGLVATLLCLGTRTIVAPVVAVPDTATMALMLALHDWLGRGLPRPPRPWPPPGPAATPTATPSSRGPVPGDPHVA
jgi:hypothetical protein